MNKQIDRQKNWQKDIQTDKKQRKGQKELYNDIIIDRKKYGQKDIKIDRQTNRWKDRYLVLIIGNFILIYS